MNFRYSPYTINIAISKEMLTTLYPFFLSVNIFVLFWHYISRYSHDRINNTLIKILIVLWTLDTQQTNWGSPPISQKNWNRRYGLITVSRCIDHKTDEIRSGRWYIGSYPEVSVKSANQQTSSQEKIVKLPRTALLRNPVSRRTSIQCCFERQSEPRDF